MLGFKSVESKQKFTDQKVLFGNKTVQNYQGNQTVHTYSTTQLGTKYLPISNSESATTLASIVYCQPPRLFLLKPAGQVTLTGWRALSIITFQTIIFP